MVQAQLPQTNRERFIHEAVQEKGLGNVSKWALQQFWWHRRRAESSCRTIRVFPSNRLQTFWSWHQSNQATVEKATKKRDCVFQSWRCYSDNQLLGKTKFWVQNSKKQLQIVLNVPSAWISQCNRSRTSPLFKDLQKFHSKEKGDHKREMVDGVWRNVCVFGDEKCKVCIYTSGCTDVVQKKT